MTNKISIESLYFGYKNYALSYSKNDRPLKTYNLFKSYRVLHCVALWVLMPEEEKKKHDALSWCFSDVKRRSEYEFVISPWIGNGDEKKVDIWTMYVEPNRQLLLDMISKVSSSSARSFLKDINKR